MDGAANLGKSEHPADRSSEWHDALIAAIQHVGEVDRSLESLSKPRSQNEEDPKDGSCSLEVGGVSDSTKSRSAISTSLASTLSIDSQRPLVARDVEKACPSQEAADCQQRKRSRTAVATSKARECCDYCNLVIFTAYRQLWLIIVISNLVAIIVAVIKQSKKANPSLAGSANAAVANLLLAVLIRQDYVKNIIYHTCWKIPHTAPLWFRRRLALVYENGGVHSGAAVSALLWFAVFTGFLWTNFARDAFTDPAVLTFDVILAVLLLSIVVAAVPQVRRKHHNVFENAHRWVGWSGIGLFWVALVFFARDQARALGGHASTGRCLLKLPAFWMLVIISAHSIYPWLLLRKVPIVKTERLTDHAIRIWFSPKERIPPLHGLAISDSPLHEWHAFAAIPDSDGSDGSATSAIISRAGDWTAKTIESPAPYYYMRGIHSTGVLAMAQIFKRVIVMATGSGIGPCLAVFGYAPNTAIHIIWSAPSPVNVFGPKIYAKVLKQDPNALIWDTRKDGRRPDMIALAEKAYHEHNAEAVFFISNRSLTLKVIQGLLKRKVAAFAPVFDS